MFHFDKTEFTQNVQNRAMKKIVEERRQFEKLFEVAKEYIKINNLIVSDINVLAGIPIQISGELDIYSENPYIDALNISNKMHKKCGKWVKLKTIIAREELVIEYDTRPILRVYRIERHRGISLKKLINYEVIDGVNYMPPEIELINVYHDLYNISKVSDWENLLARESILYEMLQKRWKTNKLGGINFMDELMRLRSALRNNLHNIDDYVIVGNWVMGANREKLQIISKNNISDDMKKISNLLSKYTNYGITYREQQLHIPRDFRTMRYTIYIKFTGSSGIAEKPLLDIFNSASFELIPYTRTKEGIIIGNAFVVLRFLLIDLWIIRIVHELNLIKKEILQIKINVIMNTIKEIKKYSCMKNVFGTDVIGTYVDAKIDKKIKLKDARVCYPYYPEMSLRRYGQYRLPR